MSLPEGKDIDEKISIIGNAADRVNAHMDDLLNLSKPPLLKLRTANINVLIEESLVEVPPEIFSNIEVVKELKDEQVNVDAERLKRVFINLIRNASESMQGKGKLQITVHRVQIKERKFISIRFEDTGHGIPQEGLEKIFNPFYTTKSKGTGLGMVICKRIIDAHQGNIEVQSKVGVGTTVIVQLPFFSS